VNVDNPEAFTKVQDDEGATYTLHEGENSFTITNGATMLFFTLNTKDWELVSFKAPNGQDVSFMMGRYVIMNPTTATGTYTVETKSKTSAETFITVDAFNANALNVTVEYTGEQPQDIWAQDGAFKIETTNKTGKITVRLNDTWQIVGLGYGAFTPVDSDYREFYYNFRANEQFSTTFDVEKILAPTTVTFKVNNTDSVEVGVSKDWGTYDIVTLTGNETKIEKGDYEVMRFRVISPWIIDTCEGYSWDAEGYYYVMFDEDKTVNVTTKQESTEEPSYITLNVDNPEAVQMTIEFDNGETVDSPAFVNGEYKIDTTSGGQVYMSPTAGWVIESAEGFLDYGTYILRFEAGDTDTYTITTKEDTSSTFITLTVDNPGSVTVEVMDTEIKTVQPQDGVYKIDTTNTGTIYVTPVAPWIISSVDGFEKNEETGVYSLDFMAGATNEYNIYTHQPAYLTLNIDNPEAVLAQITYDGGGTYEDLTLDKGENKFEITGWGSVKVTPVSPWKIDSCEGNPNAPQKDESTGAYTVFIGISESQTVTITTSEPSYITLDIDYPQGVTLFVEYNNDGAYIEPQLGGTKVDTTKGGSIYVKAKNSNWEIQSAEGFTKGIGGNYFLNFNAGATDTYTIKVTNLTGVDSIFGDEVIETAVFNLQGIKVADSTENLPAGIYIVAGKKVVVK